MPLSSIGLDFETFYDKKKKYSLRSMKNEAYILDPRFEVQGVAFKMGKYRKFMTPEEFERFARSVNWNNIILRGHNLRFDAAILAWKYGCVPAFFVDTLGLANAFIRPQTGHSDLNTCALYLGMAGKSGALELVNGKRLAEFKDDPNIYPLFAEYAMWDNDIAEAIFKRYWNDLIPAEKIKQDWSIRNYVKPALRLDRAVLAKVLGDTQLERDQLLIDTGLTDPKLLRSPHKFAELLTGMGIEVEYKTGKVDDIPAVSRKDPFIRKLLAHSDPRVVTLTKARLAFSTSLEVTRSARMIAMHDTANGWCLTPYLYHAAHTGRPGGTDGMNLTNLGRDSDLRKGILADEGYDLVEADASQVECRIVSELSGCKLLSDAFRNREDVYANFGEIVFGHPINKKDHPNERQSMKVCILSLQYGVGKVTLMNRLVVDGIPTTLDRSGFYVDVYRHTYPEVLASGKEGVNLWKRAVAENKEFEWKWGIILAPWGLQLPSGRRMYYRDLRIVGRELVYYSPRYKSWQKLYPGSFNENLGQAMANDVVGESHVRFIKEVKLHNYDALTLHVPEDQSAARLRQLLSSMSTAPWWAPSLPLAAEGKIGKTFGGPYAVTARSY